MARLLPFLRDQGGTAAAEMALVLPLLLALCFTTLEGANYVWNEHKVVMGVRDAARYAGRLDFSNYMTYSAGTYTCNGSLPNSVRDTIKNMARTGQLTGGTSRISGWVDSDIDVTFSCTAAGTTGGLYGAVSGAAPRIKVVAHPTYPSFVGTALGFQTTMKMGAVAESPVMGL